MVGKPRLLSQMHEQISLNTTRFALRESTATVRSSPLAATLVSPLKRGYAQGVSCSKRPPCTFGKMLKSCKRRRG